MLRKITMAEALKLIDKCDAVYAIKEIAAELGYPANTVAYHCHKVEREG